MAQNSPDPSRRASKAYELNQPTSAEKLYRVGNYHLRKVKGLSPFKLALITLLTLTTVYCLLLVVRVTVNSIAMKSNTRSKGDFRRASQRAADLSKGMLKGDSAPIVGQRSTADQRARKAWGRGSRSKNEPIRPVRPAIVDDEDDDYDDDCLPLESEVSDDERERRIRESISRAAQRVRKEDLLLQGSDKKAASSQGDATDDTDSNPKKRKKGPPRKFGSKSDLSRGSPSEGRRPANQGSQLEAQDVVAAAGPEPEPEIEETVPITLEGEASFENAPATSRVSADTAKQAATSDAMEDEQDEDSDDEDEDEETALPPPHPASKKVKAQRLAPKPAPRAPAPARKALVLTNDKKLRKTRRPIGKGTAAGARSGPAPLDSPSAMEEEPDKSAAQRLAEAEAQLVAARQQLAAQAALGARPDNARQRPLNAKVEPVQKMRMSRKGKVGGVARLGGADEARLVDEPEAPKKDAGRQE
ncbi:BQ2448_913 [Microbotryum intermedium]|uniref:BQ2448_913 protein n=1 Tax=Microbotryum intermedium TaxID=269621 RepID=A0A238F3Z8_9BASI|nr:BQ2448_913 [Microbotryum intermedium]